MQSTHYHLSEYHHYGTPFITGTELSMLASQEEDTTLARLKILVSTALLNTIASSEEQFLSIRLTRDEINIGLD